MFIVHITAFSGCAQFFAIARVDNLIIYFSKSINIILSAEHMFPPEHECACFLCVFVCVAEVVV